MKLPLDCLGVIVQYIKDGTIVFNLILTSKSIKNYIEHEFPQCCRHVVFILEHIPTTLKKYIYTVFFRVRNIFKIDHELFDNIRNVRYILNNSVDITDEQLSHMRDLDQVIYLRMFPKITGKGFKHLTNITELYIPELHIHFDMWYLAYLQNLKIVVMDHGFNFTHSGIHIRKLNKLVQIRIPSLEVCDEEDLINKKDLEVLEICGIDDHINERIFSNMKKLRILAFVFGKPFISKKTLIRLSKLERLVLGSVTSLCDEDLRFLPTTLEQLSIPNCKKITDLGLSYINHYMDGVNLQWNENITDEGIKQNKFLYRRRGKKLIEVFMYKAYLTAGPYDISVILSEDTYESYVQCRNTSISMSIGPWDIYESLN